MWHDVETTKDLRNFTVVADTAAQLVRESAGQPLSIGVSGISGTIATLLVLPTLACTLRAVSRGVR